MIHLYHFRSLSQVEKTNLSQGKLGHPSTFHRPGGQQVDYEPAMHPHGKNGQEYPGLREEVVSRLREVILPFCSSLMRKTWSAVPISGLHQYKKYLNLLESNAGPQRWLRNWNICYLGRG